MANTGSSEIIDLTKSSPPPEFIAFDSDDHTVEAKRARRRKKRAKMALVEDGEVVESSAQTSRDRSRDGEGDLEDPPFRQRSRSPEPLRQKSRPPQPQEECCDLFFVDVKPAPIPDSVKPEALEDTSSDISKLLLPDHVSVFGLREDGKEPVEIIRPSTPNTKEDEQSFIEYVDYDDKSQGAVRYFDLAGEDSKQTKFVCKNCGIEGEHKTFECPVQICLTCGARNEHSTRGCPISKTCYSCGMKGHISQNCPNRHSRGAVDFDSQCDRCGSGIHKTNECPTWWRIYEYVSDDERLTILQAREAKRSSEFGKGGEAYIGSEDFCYNCGSSGHLGDDCNEVPRLEFSLSPSAFGIYNTMSGPFFDPSAEQEEYKANRRNSGWGPSALPDDWGMSAPAEVGKQGRKKDKMKMEQSFKEQETNDDSDNWFDKPKTKRSGMMAVAPFLQERPGLLKKMAFGPSIKDAGKQFQPPSAAERPKLLDRIGTVDDRSGNHARHHDRRGSGSVREDYAIRVRRASTQQQHRDFECSRRDWNNQGWRDRSRGRDRDDVDRDRRRDRDRGRWNEERGPRYKGGYSR